MWTLFWKYMLLLLSTVLFYILFSKEKLLDRRKKGIWNKLTRMGRFYLAMYILAVIGQGWLDYQETSSKNQIYEDLKASLAPKDRAKLSFCNPIAEMKTNPFPYYKDSAIYIKFHICNEGNDDATHIADTLVIVGQIGTRRFFDKVQFRGTNSNQNVPLGILGVTLEEEMPKIPNPYFVYLKMCYTNSKGALPDTLRNIFYINGLEARDTYQDEFDSVKSIIVEKNMW